MMKASWAEAAVAALVSVAVPEMAAAQPADVRAFDIPAQDLASALKAFAAASGREVVAPSEIVRGKRSARVAGQLPAEQAIERLLVGTGLSYRVVEGAFIVGPVPSARAEAAATPDDGEILVTGTRIRGTPVASPVIAIRQEDIRNQARADLGEVVRAIPQSFGGGQNPGIGANVPTASGGDVGGGSSLNLRGLGSDATLTLLNGHRLAYSAAVQSVDVSAIPLAAVERIEVVPDGASAIYGSDAVAGVANIILRRRYSGLETGARLAATSGGGGFQQRYDALAGTTWSTGGVWAAYEYGSNTAIRSDNRAYARPRSPGLDLFPALRHHSAVASAYQTLASGLTAKIDALYNIRWSDSTMPTLPGGDLDAGRASFHSKDVSYGIAPTVELDLAANWRVALTATYGKERVDFHQLVCAGADCADSGANFYRNTAKSVELAGSGDLVALPAGTAKAALGAGYRAIGFERFSTAVSAANTLAAQDSYFAYGELSLPLVGPGQGLRFVHRLDLDAAVRYERYPDIGSVVTPKIGAAWSLTGDVALKGSWGRSFRAPTLFQQYQPRAATLYPPALLGASGADPAAGAILLLGGSPDLKPERATTWSATLDLHPRAVPGLTVAVSYFRISYRDRIVSPITRLSQALSNPLYAGQVIVDPSPSELAAALASASSFTNFTGIPYDPANVVAIVDNAYVNAGRQSARGVDVLASYSRSLGAGQQLSVSAGLAYLESEQQLSASHPVEPLAGTIFNPPHWRGQGSASWSSGPLTLTAALSHTGGVKDTRFAPPDEVGGMTTVDLMARYRVEGSASLFKGTEFALSVQNLFNEAPDPIAVGAPYETPYDSTNYSPVGRLLAVEVRKTW